jgi:type IV pilus assembly protein PilP
MENKYLLKVFIAMFMFFSLSACSKVTLDLEKFFQQTKSSNKSKLKELPQYIAYEQYTYTSDDVRDPFIAESEVLIVQEDTSDKLAPDSQRKKEPLGYFPIDTLQMVGTLEKEFTWALIRTPEGVIHRVRQGNYMGLNYGKIIALNNTNVTVNEIIKDGMGDWVERTATKSIGELSK